MRTCQDLAHSLETRHAEVTLPLQTNLSSLEIPVQANLLHTRKTHTLLLTAAVEELNKALREILLLRDVDALFDDKLRNDPVDLISPSRTH